MRKLFIVILLCAITHLVYSQEKEKETVKTGWSYGVLPSISYSTDLGFQYGGLINLYHYGDGSRYPMYNHSLYLEISRYTKGSGINRIYYDSDRLISGLRTIVDLSYLVDNAFDFYGFNGYNAIVNDDFFDDEAEEYRTRMFYKYERRIFRFKVDLQGKLGYDNLKWSFGVNLKNYKIDEVDIEKLNEDQDEEDLLPDVDGLYNYYVNWGAISKEEKNGGFVPLIKAGLVYDTRDNRASPMKGMWTEFVIGTAPEFLGSESSFAKFGITHRQYFTIVPRDLSIAYRLGYQTTIAGNTPFYYQNHIMTSYLNNSTNEGLGGSDNIRGIYRNRIIGDGIFYGNLEARYKFYRFMLFKNNFYLGLNGFWDFGMVTKEMDFKPTIDNSHENEYKISDFYEKDKESLHSSAGLGLKIAMNENFIISVDYGLALDDRDGTSSIYIGLNYLF